MFAVEHELGRRSIRIGSDDLDQLQEFFSTAESATHAYLRVCHRDADYPLYINGVAVHLGVTEINEVVLVWPRAANALIVVKLNS